MQFDQLKRREFVTLVGGAAVAWPLAARAQQPAMPVIGFLGSTSPGPFARFAHAFRQGLNDGGYVEGRNVAIEYRWAEGQFARLPELAADLVRRRVVLIAAIGGTMSARAAKAATQTIPILFIGGPDPVGEGLVTSLNRPGGNVTGAALQTAELMPKRLQLLNELVPHAATIALLVNPIRSLELDVDARLLEAGTRATGQKMVLLNASVESELEPAFASAVRQRAGALLVSASAFFTDRRVQLVTLAARHGLPAAYPFREYADAGGLMSYGPSIADVYRLIGRYASRILKGDKPADLPVQLPTKFELILNLKTAKALGLDVPGTLLARADELLE
jgi:ABC-type uncharacterized transport system substrate-binding protein